MAEAFLRILVPEWSVCSAGTEPARMVHPLAIRVMEEIGIDLRNARPKSVVEFLDQPFDIVLTVCHNAKGTCPVFTGTVVQRMHIGFEDPAEARGTEEEILRVFRRVRDEIQTQMISFHERERSAPVAVNGSLHNGEAALPPEKSSEEHRKKGR